ncbi:hypothetical protein [Ferribacterium limneticum]|uniref:hypothetical protein n=1 Tax=Ferribacterium limneticum TaxID=76259 RepID=UPI001CFA1CF7|nr:hypothetical protein [Ferribacterium limneticum]UCV27711.1 hypothetical protein KI617_15820 [Ferribacterium limneticum]UCV31628.1 hypothetical protein KI608_15820 [Ferribacterium limneticum]
MMRDKNDFQALSSLSQGELVIFRRHMAFRLCICLWALYSIVYDSLSKAFVALLVLACFYAMGEIVFTSYMGYARLNAQRDEEQKRLEEKRLEKEAKLAAQAAASAEYFDLGKSGRGG